jgi:hypothetical protein
VSNGWASAPPAASRLALVHTTMPAPGRPRVRVTKALPGDASPEAAIAAARARAAGDPTRRFQVFALADGAEPRLLWDSHPAS